MILYNDQNFPEIYRQMKDEKEKVDYYLNKIEKESLRYIAKTPAPCYSFQKITMPKTGNTYLLYYYCLTENERRHGSAFFGNLLLLNDDQGRRVVIRLMKTEERSQYSSRKLDSLHIFTGHFFSRYRERFFSDKDATTDDIVVSFAGRNLGYLHQLKYEEFVKEKDRRDNGAAWIIEDGVSVGASEMIHVNDKPLWIAMHKTYLSPAELKDDQMNSIIPKEVLHEMLTHHFK